MKLSVIVPCLNAARTVGELLDALVGQPWLDEWEVIVADNGSTDNLRHVVERYKGRLPSLRVVEASARRGASYARNVGVKAATGDAILFCDADDIPAYGWAVEMNEALRKHDFVASCLEFEKLNPPSVRAARGTTQVLELQRFSFLPYPFAGSGTLGIKRALHEAIDGFDETIPICEDIDYCMRVQQRGQKLELVPGATLHCRLRSKINGAYIQAFRYAEYEVCLYKKYGHPHSGELWRWRKYVQSWRKLLGRLPELIRTAEGRTLLVWRIGRLTGLLKGSLRFGVPPVMVE